MGYVCELDEGYVCDQDDIGPDDPKGKYFYKEDGIYFHNYDKYHLLEQDYSQKISPNMIVMRNGQYSYLFGNAPITRLDVGQSCLYFADYDIINALHKESIKKKDKKIEYIYNVPGNGMRVGEDTIPPYVYSYQDWSGGTSQAPGTVVQKSTGFLSNIGSFPALDDRLESEDLKKEYNKYYDLANEYVMHTPTAIKINLPDLEASDIQEFKSKEEYRDLASISK